jgi:hypothetical protein
VQYSLLKETRVGTGPEKPCLVDHNSLSQLIEPQHHHKKVPYTPGVAITLLRDVPYYYEYNITNKCKPIQNI